MCIIASSEIGMALPSNETITRMWCKNPDGAGFMYNHNGKVVIRKGFMTLKDFNAALDNLKTEIDTVNTAVIMHFRIGTHGGNIPENTHPFPITDTEPLLKKLSLNCDIGMAHNGIIHNVTPRNNISDTMEYVLEFLSQFKQIDKKFYVKPIWQKIIENTIDGSRMCFLNSDGEINYVGNWETDEETGIKYSNAGYKSYASSYGKFWDWGYDDDEKLDVKGGYLYPESEPLSVIETGYVVDEHGNMYDCEEETFLLDEFNVVYRYEYDFEFAVRMTGATAYNVEGGFAEYNEETACLVDWYTEDEFEEYLAEWCDSSN